jgi:hypothetical protein
VALGHAQCLQTLVRAAIDAVPRPLSVPSCQSGRSRQRAEKAGFTRKTAQAGLVTLIQRFGSALNLNVYFHMLLLDRVYAERPDGVLRFSCM